MSDVSAEEMLAKYEQYLKDPATREILRRWSNAIEYAHSHDVELRRRFPNRWVAVDGNGVVAVEDSHSTLLDSLSALGIEPGCVHTEFLREPRPATAFW